jgi:hypothetical protein
VSHGAGAPQTLDRVERLGRSGWHGEVLVRADLNAGRMQLSPIAIFDGPLPVSLSLDSDKLLGRNGSLWSELWLRLNPLRGHGSFRRSPAGATVAALSAAWQRLIDLAEAGPGSPRPALLDDIRACARLLDRLGHSVVADRLVAVADDPRANFLRAGYALLLARDQHISMPMLAWSR